MSVATDFGTAINAELNDYVAWARERADLALQEELGIVSSTSWQNSDDAAASGYDRMAELLSRIVHFNLEAAVCEDEAL